MILSLPKSTKTLFLYNIHLTKPKTKLIGCLARLMNACNIRNFYDESIMGKKQLPEFKRY